MTHILGLDCGIASIGWAVLDVGDGTGNIVAAGTRMFDTPETDKERRPKSELRRMFRGQRRVIRRRRQRMNAVRRLLHAAGLLDGAGADALRYQGIDPWQARAAARQRLLTPRELAVALGHIARHRGFRSNAKDRGNDPEGSKMKKAMAETQERMAGQSFGEFIAASPGRKRNREGDYAHTPHRDDLAHEVRLIFAAQRRLGSMAATDQLERDFTETAFFQRPLQDSEALLAACAFEPGEKRTAKRAYSFELFRYLSRLNTLEVREGGHSRRLTAEEVGRAMAAFGTTKKINYKALRGIAALPEGASFATVRRDEEANDVVARHGEAAHGTATLRKLLGTELWSGLAATPERLDRIAEVITFRESAEAIRRGLAETGLDPATIDRLVAEAEAGSFDTFTGAGHISSCAARNLIPHLAQGLVYSDACARHGYDHTASRERNAFSVGVRGKQALKLILQRQVIDRSLIGSPIARKALIEAVKQVKAIIEVHGLPDMIHIELARDVGKGIDERREIERGIEKRNREKDRLRLRFREDVGHDCASAEDLLRYELWLQQNGRCLYTGEAIPAAHIGAGSNLVQVDHILPWSRFGDDSFNNKTLCFTRANQQKRGRTPFEWFSSDRSAEDWELYLARVQELPGLKNHKRKLYTLRDAAAQEEGFRNRNLNDTRWTCRLLAECLRQLYQKGEEQRVRARPGALTDRLRRGWGLQWLKKDADGNRLADDRHHALDAIITAACTEAQLQALTRAFQREEAAGTPRDFRALEPPWPSFREQALAAVEAVFVSRAERRRARGEAHAATIRSVAERDGEPRAYERKRVADLKLTDLARVKDPERNHATIAALRSWIEQGKPESNPPLSPKGDIIAKVTLQTNKKPELLLSGGAADRGEMARVDVFRKKTKKGGWNFFLVPIYPHEIATSHEPPSRCVPGDLDPGLWPGTGEAEFIFSLGSLSLVEVVKSDGEVITHYLRGLDRSTGALNMSPHHTLTMTRRSIGPRTALSFRKLVIDRLGNISEAAREKRTWRGKACT